MAGKTLRNLVIAAALAGPVGALVAPAPVANATTIAPLSIEQLTDAADYVVRGDITEVWTEVDDNGRIWTRARMTVQRVFKGADDPTELIIDSMGGSYGGQTLHIEAQAVFSQYEDALVFLHQREQDGKLVPVGKFVGKYTISRAPEDAQKYARTWHPKPGFAFDARFLPHVEPEKRLYIDDLFDRIETRLDTGWDGKPIPGLSATRLEAINTRERRKR